MVVQPTPSCGRVLDVRPFHTASCTTISGKCVTLFVLNIYTEQQLAKDQLKKFLFSFENNSRLIFINVKLFCFLKAF